MLAKRTGLSEDELKKKQEMFIKQFPDGQITKDEFKEIAYQLIDDSDIDGFVENVFRMFDINQDRSLDFVEYVLATSSAELGNIENASVKTRSALCSAGEASDLPVSIGCAVADRHLGLQAGVGKGGRQGVGGLRSLHRFLRQFGRAVDEVTV